MKNVSLIVATTTEYGIGKDNTIPWNIPEELNNFKKITSDIFDKNKQNCVIMGRNTWASLPKKPLPNRLNIIVSSSLIGQVENKNSNVVIINNILDAIKYAKEREDVESIFIIGGETVYNAMLNNHIEMIYKIYLSVISDKFYECDKFIDMERIYKNFDINAENVHVLERYIFMIFDKKKTIKHEPMDEPVD